MTSVSGLRSNPPTPSTPQPLIPHNTPNAALTGASTAFARPPLKPKPSLPTYAGVNGALIAATKAGSQQNSPTHKPAYGGSLSRQSTGNSVQQSTTSPSPSRWRLQTPDSTSTLQLPIDSNSSRTKSPSNIAATLAAARHTPSVQKQPATQARVMQIQHWPEDVKSAVQDAPTAGSVQRLAAQRAAPRPGDGGRDMQGRGGAVESTAEKLTDDTSIPPTSALVKMFEQAKALEAITPATPRTPEATKSPSQPPILSPTPRRTFSLKKVDDEKRLEETAEQNSSIQSRNAAPIPAAKPKRLSSTKSISKEKPSTPLKTAAEQQKYSGTPPTNSPTQERSTDAMETSSVSSYESAPETADVSLEDVSSKNKPEPPPPRRMNRPKVKAGKAASKSPPRPRHSKPQQIPSTQPMVMNRPPTDPYDRPTSVPNSLTSAYGRQNLKHITTHMTGDSLANAMVGAALASSRNPSRQISPVRTGPPSLPKRHERQGHTHKLFGHSRTPSPVKQPGKLRQTLRKEESSSSSEEDHHKRRPGMFRRKHPNKHHEGARKRWRDTITAHERKRYEGVWAANKGVHINPAHIPPHKRFGNEDSEVLDLVVKDIWARSRLPAHVLEEVWELVDTRKVGRLTKEEFVVGLWLVDQRLKGRKLPTRVGESVWASVTGAGVNIKYLRK